MIDNIDTLIEEVYFRSPSIIVVEGYNGVGKSVVVKALQDAYGTMVYRPDYAGWAGNVKKEDRWAIFASFMDVATDFGLLSRSRRVFIFDRGMLCGAVYNNERIIPYYKEVIRNVNVLNILVSCEKDSYEKFLRVRNNSKPLYYEDCAEVTEKYRKVFKEAGASYIEYQNIYNEELGKLASKTCSGCSHYNVSDSCCKHPDVRAFVDADRYRCSHSPEMEVQDLGELQSVSFK